MSYLLRHNPNGLQMDEKGFVRLGDLLRRVRERYDVDEAFIRDIVHAGDKTRFQIVGGKIRALYGHTIDVEIDLPEDEGVEVLYHGTTAESASKILEKGLRSMRRRWVHLSATKEIAREVGRRRTPNPVILVIYAKEARRDGITFYKATDRVYLSKRIPSKYIRKLEYAEELHRQWSKSSHSKRYHSSKHRYTRLLGDNNVVKERRPLLTVDVIIRRRDGSIVLVKRLNPPFKDSYAIPGGFVEYEETVEEAAIREAKEETGLDVRIRRLVGVYSDPDRDPRGHVVTIAYLAEEIGGILRPSGDAREVKVFRKIPSKLAFDHRKILRDALELASSK